MIYTQLKEKYAAELAQSIAAFNLISIVRLGLVIVFLIVGYYYLVNYNAVWLFIGLAIAAVFAVLVYFHDKIRRKRDLETALLNLNKEEESFVKRESLPFENGIEFSEDNHPYAYDIDIFGQSSLFQNLNRCGTVPGKAKLASWLKAALSPEEILQNQEAVEELRNKLDFRQKLLAVARMNKDSKALYDNILKWVKMKNPEYSPIVRILSFVMPLALFGVIIAYFAGGSESLSNVITYLFLANLGILYSQLKKIQQQIVSADRVREVIRQYGMIIHEIEKESFQSEKLKALQAKLQTGEGSSGLQLQKLASLFNSLEAIQNFLGAVIFNGLFLYHLHTLYALLKWKRKYSEKINDWLDVIAELEALNSFAGLAYNNPNFAFPEINSENKIVFEELGHPMIDPKKRVDNDVDFSNNPFILLTGSNMSGKSTFLRALGVNMVLAAAGSVVCSKKATINPMPLYVSMRLSDSLADSESYFYAEIKRLHEIMSHLNGQRAFVLLDEILRGTNSDDKRNGTIGVVKKMVERNAVGAIATHDLEVCLTTNEYPNYLCNKCFEVEILNDNLHFDYKLKTGVSKNKSATFLMEKMEII
jgi:ABC-type multidrug transport system fused ATPase/permease subunit